jgi:hypothetical protein
MLLQRYRWQAGRQAGRQAGCCMCEQTEGRDSFCGGNVKVREEHRLRSDEGGERYIIRSLMIGILHLVHEPYYIEQASFVIFCRYAVVLVGCRLCQVR